MRLRFRNVLIHLQSTTERAVLKSGSVLESNFLTSNLPGGGTSILRANGDFEYCWCLSKMTMQSTASHSSYFNVIFSKMRKAMTIDIF